MTMPDLFEQLDSPAENGDDWIRRLLSEPDETPSPTPAAGDDGTDTGRVIALQVDHRDLLDDAAANFDFARAWRGAGGERQCKGECRKIGSEFLKHGVLLMR